MFKTKA